jgi:hypothetical protein
MFSRDGWDVELTRRASSEINEAGGLAFVAAGCVCVAGRQQQERREFRFRCGGGGGGGPTKIWVGAECECDWTGNAPMLCLTSSPRWISCTAQLLPD